MPRGGTIHVATTHGQMPDGSPAVVLTVSDTGSGMDAATRSRIFEPFFTTKERGKGTGLGLSTVLGIVAEAGGSITVESEPGAGATFTITFPSAAPTDAPVSVRAKSLLPARASETLLLVEDERQVRHLARRILVREGYHIVEADSPRQALALADAPGARIDLLITDVVMPKMNGVELIRRLQAKCPELRTLCMSGYTEDETARRGLRELKVPFLQKPFTPDTLRQKVREALDQT
jgi:two-component system cell cycle sensor histidine kinase/response regulator CckA